MHPAAPVAAARPRNVLLLQVMSILVVAVAGSVVEARAPQVYQFLPPLSTV
jgi:hypothetical protein